METVDWWKTYTENLPTDYLQRYIECIHGVLKSDQIPVAVV